MEIVNVEKSLINFLNIDLKETLKNFIKIWHGFFK